MAIIVILLGRVKTEEKERARERWRERGRERMNGRDGEKITR